MTASVSRHELLPDPEGSGAGFKDAETASCKKPGRDSRGFLSGLALNGATPRTWAVPRRSYPYKCANVE